MLNLWIFQILTSKRHPGKCYNHIMVFSTNSLHCRRTHNWWSGCSSSSVSLRSSHLCPNSYHQTFLCRHSSFKRMDSNSWSMRRRVLKTFLKWIHYQPLNFRATLFQIFLGSITLEGNDPSQLELATSSYTLHPDYNPLTLENDLGLIKLRMPITFTGKTSLLVWQIKNIF